MVALCCLTFAVRVHAATRRCAPELGKRVVWGGVAYGADIPIDRGVLGHVGGGFNLKVVGAAVLDRHIALRTVGRSMACVKGMCERHV